MDVAQTASFFQSMTYEAGILDYEEFPVTTEPVWILGNQYSAIHELDEIKCDFLSRLWFTYRRGFAPIGGTGPSTDAGWGCMLRCGQMMLAQALVNRHLGRGWRWIPGKYEPRAFEILRMFLDKKGSTYSIHQIASMGASEGKAVGEWFGPNTVAQVLKKLAVYDEWSNLVVHVALDNTVIIDDICQMCMICESPKTMSASTTESKSSCCSTPGGSMSASWSGGEPSMPSAPRPQNTNSSVSSCDNKNSAKCTSLNGLDHEHSSHSANREQTSRHPHTFGLGSPKESCRCGSGQSVNLWRPLLLIIPLRLGLSEINPVYLPALKKCLMFPQSVGIIGGKPNHAHWFIGHVEDQLLYLDPHTTQYYADITLPAQDDRSYHCDYISRMRMTHLDPSIAVGFYCGSKSDFMDLCKRIRNFIIEPEKTPMFELHEHRPPHWPVFEPYSPDGASGIDFTVVDEAERLFDTDEEFELL